MPGWGGGRQYGVLEAAGRIVRDEGYLARRISAPTPPTPQPPTPHPTPAPKPYTLKP